MAFVSPLTFPTSTSLRPRPPSPHHVIVHHAMANRRSNVKMVSSASTSSNQTKAASSATEQILQATNLSKSHDASRCLFKDQNISVHRGDKICILGPNGSGKTSLLHILAGISSPDTGHVSIRKGTISALVSQSLPSELDTDLTVTSAVLKLASSHASTPPIRAALRHSNALSSLASCEKDGEDSALHYLAKVTQEMDACPGAWEVDSRVSSALVTLGLPVDKPLNTLSGGQKRRVGIAAAIICKPDILFLDEVTNHLSIDGIQFLESFLSDPSLTFIAISHDRAFVNAVCSTSIWELDTGEIHRYSTPYEMFIGEKEKRLRDVEKRNDNMQKAYKKQLEWLRKQPKARSTKNKSRVETVLKLEQDVITNKQTERQRNLKLRALSPVASRLGGDVVTLNGVTVKRGDKVIVKDFSYVFENGERVGICGKNGVGKSSLLKAIAGVDDSITIAEGGNVHVGDTVVFGYFDQDGIDLSQKLSEGSAAARGVDFVLELRVIDYVSELLSTYGDGAGDNGVTNSNNSNKNIISTSGDEKVDIRVQNELERLSYSGNSLARQRTSSKNDGNMLSKMNVVNLLDHFGFSKERQYGYIRHLSGGEKRRLQLMGLLLKNPNFLILDEVSNDLDVNTLTMIEQVLDEYQGVLLLCSHDRFMLDRLVDHLLVIEADGSVRLVEGKFTDYLQDEKVAKEQGRVARQKQTDLKSGNVGGTKKKNNKLSYKQRKEYDNLESEIKKYEEEYNILCGKLENEAQDAGYEQIQGWSESLASLEKLVEEKTERWLHLAELQSTEK